MLSSSHLIASSLVSAIGYFIYIDFLPLGIQTLVAVPLSRSGMSDAPSSSEGGVSSVTGGSPREPKSFVSVTSARNDEEEENESTNSKEERNEEDSSKPEEIRFEKIDLSKTQNGVVTHLGNALKALETKIKVDFACPEEEKKPKPEVVSVYSKCSVKQAISAIVEHCQTNRPDLREILREKNPLRYELVLAFDDFVMESALDFDKFRDFALFRSQDES